MDSFEFVLFTVMWERILRAMDSTSKELMSPKLGLSVASRLMNCSISEIELLRNSWESAKMKASALPGLGAHHLNLPKKETAKSSISLMNCLAMNP